MMPLFDELIKTQQQGINFLQESGVPHKELEQKQKFLNAIKEFMQVANEAIIDLISAVTRKDVMEDLFIGELIRQRNYHAAWEEHLWHIILHPHFAHALRTFKKRNKLQHKKAA